MAKNEGRKKCAPATRRTTSFVAGREGRRGMWAKLMRSELKIGLFARGRRWRRGQHRFHLAWHIRNDAINAGIDKLPAPCARSSTVQAQARYPVGVNRVDRLLVQRFLVPANRRGPGGFDFLKAGFVQFLSTQREARCRGQCDDNRPENPNRTTARPPARTCPCRSSSTQVLASPALRSMRVVEPIWIVSSRLFRAWAA